MKKKILLIFFGFLLFCLIGCESTTFTITFTYEDGTEITKVEVKGGFNNYRISRSCYS